MAKTNICFFSIAIMALFSLALAQTLPVTSGLIFHFKADAIAQSNNTAVSNWVGSSGSIRNATQGNASQQPLFMTSIVNGKPAVLFDGSNDYMKINDYSTQIPYSGQTIYAVYRTLSQITRYSNGNGSYNRLLSITTTGGPDYMFNTGGYLIESDEVNGGNWHLFSALLAPSNYSPIGNAAFGNYVSVYNGPFAMDVNYPYRGYLAEFVMYNRTLTALENISVSNMLAVKYGFPSGGPYAISTCGALGSANTTYALNQSVLATGGTCFTVTAQNVTLDCQGYSITGNNASGTFGVYSNQFNTAIKNCNISNFDTGILFNGAANGRIDNDTVSTTSSAYIAPTWSAGITLYNGTNWTVITRTNSQATAGPGIGVYMNAGNNLIANSNFISLAHDGLAITTNCSNNTVANSTITGGRPIYGALNIYVSSYNRLANNTIYAISGVPELTIVGSDNNIVYWNNFTATTGLYVNDTTGSNFYNVSMNGHGEGNIWPNIMNGGIVAKGSQASAYGAGLYYATSGTGVPYSSATSNGKVTAGVTDYAPLTNQLVPAPNVSTFTSGSSTNFSAVADLTNVTNLTLEKVGFGKIEFPSAHSVNAAGQDYDSNIAMGNGFISVNSSGLDPSFNSTAMLAMNLTGVYSGASAPAIYYYEPFVSSQSAIIANGSVCLAPRCTGVLWNQSTSMLTFNVSGFSGYAANTSPTYSGAGGAPMNSSGTLGINITSTNQIAVYTSSSKNNSAFSFIPVTPPAAGSITLMSNESSNVTSGDTGFLVENQGNVNVSITVASDKNASLFIGGSTSLFRMFGAQNKTGSCPGINATMQDLGNTPITICPSLAFADTQDTVWAYVLVRINSDSPPQTSTATLTFTSTQN